MPIVFEENLGNDTSIALWKIEETAQELETQLQLKAHELNFLRSLVGEKRNLQWLATRVLLRKMLNTDNYIDVRSDENGKPYLKSKSHHISLSHSYNYAAVIISKSKKVGIDIEIIKPKIEKIAFKFLSDTEYKNIDTQNTIAYLYVCWCAKEALYKLNGLRETSFKNHIFLHPFTFKNHGSFDATIIKDLQKDNFTVYYKQINDYMLGYVLAGN
ncbi:MAG: 4'-phosphopantetheinyl transferase superfamily protein [Sphingobacteriales bacterium]|nr:MAG: 4'-phosphopantetheinyl transferase superfamily protein [Sphingobacteriales bacterium]TAF83379.1 MAG: 4'-phosphopantetheinyl transferase superfamily protein [Sphingobacteriales bacterium]